MIVAAAFLAIAQCSEWGPEPHSGLSVELRVAPPVVDLCGPASLILTVSNEASYEIRVDPVPGTRIEWLDETDQTLARRGSNLNGLRIYEPVPSCATWTSELPLHCIAGPREPGEYRLVASWVVCWDGPKTRGREVATLDTVVRVVPGDPTALLDVLGVVRAEWEDPARRGKALGTLCAIDHPLAVDLVLELWERADHLERRRLVRALVDVTDGYGRDALRHLIVEERSDPDPHFGPYGVEASTAYWLVRERRRIPVGAPTRALLQTLARSKFKEVRSMVAPWFEEL